MNKLEKLGLIMVIYGCAACLDMIDGSKIQLIFMFIVVAGAILFFYGDHLENE